MALPVFYKHIVANVSALKVYTSSVYLQTHSAQAIAHYIKKSTLNLSNHTSANNGIDFFGGSF
jgi:hypothetical protein